MKDSKACTKCGQVADKTETLCKLCHKRAKNLEAAKRYKAKNPEVARNYQRLNKDKLNAYAREWRKRNPSKASEYGKRSREKNPEAARESYRKYSKNNPEYIRHKSAKRRALAKKNGAYFISQAELKKLYRSPCFYCGNAASHLDHVVPLSRGGQHSIGNLVPACASCNLQKNDRFITEWKMSAMRDKL